MFTAVYIFLTSFSPIFSGSNEDADIANRIHQEVQKVGLDLFEKSFKCTNQCQIMILGI